MTEKFFKISSSMKPVEWSSDTCIRNRIADSLHFGDILIFDCIVHLTKLDKS